LNLKIITIISTVIFVVLSATFVYAYLQAEDSDIEIKTLSQTHTYHHQSTLKTIEIPILINTLETYHLNEEAIESVRIQDDHQVIPIHLVRVEHEYSAFINQHQWHQLNLVVAPSFETEDANFTLESAKLVINYKNGEQTLFNIGEFNYQFKTTETDHNLLIKAMHNTHENLGFGMTSTGVVLTLENQTNTQTCLIDVSINSAFIKPSFGSIKNYTGAIEPFMTSDDIIPNYNHLIRNQKSVVPICFNRYESQTLYVPFDYTKETLLYQYPLTLTFRQDGDISQIIIEDFRFIKQSMFEVLNEEVINHYVFERN